MSFLNKKYLVLLCFFLLYSLDVFSAGIAITEKNRNPALIELMQELIYQYNVPGVVLTYGFNDEPLQTLSVGFDDLKSKKKIKNNNLFITGSVTKSFIAAAILQAVDSKFFDLDDKLQKIALRYGGELAAMVKKYPSLGDVTVRQLLVHTSGVPEDINTYAFTEIFNDDPYHIWNDSELLTIAMQKPFFFKPGTPGFCSYTNTDYLLLGFVLKSVTHKSIEEILRNLWMRAGLSNDIYYGNGGIIPKNVSAKMAVGYIDVNDPNPLRKAFSNLPIIVIPGRKKINAYELKNAYSNFLGTAGGIITSTKVLAQWYRVLFQSRFFSKISLDQMLNGGVVIGKYQGIKYGFGVVTFDSPKYGYFVSHNGFSPGYSVVVFYFSKYDLVLSIAINASNSDFMETINFDTGKIEVGVLSKIMPILLRKK